MITCIRNVSVFFLENEVLQLYGSQEEEWDKDNNTPPLHELESLES